MLGDLRLFVRTLVALLDLPRSADLDVHTQLMLVSYNLHITHGLFGGRT